MIVMKALVYLSKFQKPLAQLRSRAIQRHVLFVSQDSLVYQVKIY